MSSALTKNVHRVGDTPGGVRRAAGCDGFVMVTPESEYNHSTSGALKNAINFLYNEWNNIVRRRSDVRSSDLPSS